ncbi:MAG: RsmD family RNA methyltransferase [Candidatus Saccharibacteria bacterium]|nr:RsmD family RNA methyltransferase [Candidatus Saccharibacteria bacterium]
MARIFRKKSSGEGDGFSRKNRAGAGDKRRRNRGEDVRVASGFLRGRKISTPGVGTHPMGSREKLALFNMISGYLMRAEVLDAYAGSGALGIEALSRGARHAIFIEKAERATEVIRENLGRLGLLEDSEIFKGSVAGFETSRRFDVVIADPPYDNFEILEALELAKLVKDEGVFVLSHPGEAPEVEGFVLKKTNSYAKAHISVYVK